MEIKTGISLQTKQQLSQLQVESLNILAMSMTELKDFQQNEEIENPLVEYTSGKEEAAPITYKETERFYNGTDRDERRENELYEIEDSEKSLEDLVNTQLQWEQIGETERKIVDFCIQSLEQSGYLMIPPKDIAKDLGVAEEQVEEVLSMLKELEPQGLFASGLEECLLMQVRGMDEEELLSDIIRNHLQDIAEGKISTISRGLKISSADPCDQELKSAPIKWDRR